MRHHLNGLNVAKYLITAILAGGVLLCVFTPELFVFKRGIDFTVQIMLAYLVLGMTFFILNQRTLMFVSLGACAVLCLDLKGVSNQSLRLPTPNAQHLLSCALINLSLSDDLEETTRIIREAPVDVLVFQEYTPDWHAYLTEIFEELFPYRASMTRIDPFGMAYYSRVPVISADTFYTATGIPNLHVLIEGRQEAYTHLVSVHTVAPANTIAYREIRRHLHEVADYVRYLHGPVIAMGDLNLPSWANEVREFKTLAGLQDSRRDIVPVSMQGSFSLLKVPVDHIFYSGDIECSGFQSINGRGTSHLGIMGSYQLTQDILIANPQ